LVDTLPMKIALTPESPRLPIALEQSHSIRKDTPAGGGKSYGQCNFTACLVPDGHDILASCDMSPGRLVKLVDALR